MIPAVPPGDVYDLCFGFFGAVVTSIDLKAGALQMAKAGRKPQVLSRGRGKQTLEFSYPIGIQGLQRPAEGIIVQLFGGHAGRDESVGGFILEKPGDEVEGLSDQPSAIEHHGFDGFPHGEVPQFRVLVGGLVDHVAHAECVEHASHKAEVVQDLATVRRLVGHNHLLC